MLVVRRSGGGKSAVYWAATLAHRDVGVGPTIVVSPLLVLMRDQVQAAQSIGIHAATANSSNRADWDVVFDRLDRDELDVLLVSPERLSHPQFLERAMPMLKSSGLLVIDEAHCISDCRFDFRADHQRIAGCCSHWSRTHPCSPRRPLRLPGLSNTSPNSSRPPRQ